MLNSLSESSGLSGAPKIGFRGIIPIDALGSYLSIGCNLRG